MALPQAAISKPSRSVPRKSRTSGRIIQMPGASTHAKAPDSPAVAQKSSLSFLSPLTPSPGETAAGGTGQGDAGMIPIPGLGLSWDQAIGIYDRNRARAEAPRPLAPGVSTGRPNRPEPAPSPAQTPAPEASGLPRWVPWTVALVLVVIGYLVFGWIGALVGAAAGVAAALFLF